MDNLSVFYRIGKEIKIDNEVDSNLYEKGCVVSQDIAPKSKMKKGRAVYVVVSRGSKIVPVPGLIGSLTSKAVIDLKNAFLDVGYEASVPSASVPENIIIAQSPPAGENVPSGSVINILKSSGPKKPSFIMPDFKGNNISVIYGAMKKYELVISGLSVKENDTLDSGSVLEQSPQAGSKIDRETPITFIVSKKPNDARLKQRLIKFTYRREDAGVPVLIKINVLSLNGSETVYNEMTQPGRLISASASVRGDALVQVFSGTKVVKEMDFKLEGGQ